MRAGIVGSVPLQGFMGVALLLFSALGVLAA